MTHHGTGIATTTASSHKNTWGFLSFVHLHIFFPSFLSPVSFSHPRPLRTSSFGLASLPLWEQWRSVGFGEVCGREEKRGGSSCRVFLNERGEKGNPPDAAEEATDGPCCQHSCLCRSFAISSPSCFFSYTSPFSLFLSYICFIFIGGTLDTS